MTAIAWLEKRSPSVDDDAPYFDLIPIACAAFDDAEPEETEETDGLSLDEFFCALEYTASDGSVSRRRTTLRKLSQGRYGLYVTAICHERRAIRTFRLDRIAAIIDADGQVFEPVAFLTGILGVDVDWLTPGQDASAASRARAIRDQHRAALSILVAAAYCDGAMDETELAAIMEYAESETLRDGTYSGNLSDFDALATTLRHMRLTREALPGYANAIAKYDTERFQRFSRALRRVVDADRHLTIEEQEFVAELQRSIPADWQS